MKIKSASGKRAPGEECPLILPAFSDEDLGEALEEAVRLLQKGELIALPTETVYGLAADARNPQAVTKIFQAKGRPSFNPIIVHVGSLEMARECVISWPPEADKLARAFWPGPLSIILKRSPLIPDVVTAAGDTVAIRWPAQPVFQKVIQKCGFPLAAPSANRSNSISPTTAEHVRSSLGSRIPLILDGGPCAVGIESTVVDLSSPGEPRVLRPGMISREMIDAVLGSKPTTTAVRESHSGGGAAAPLKSPGQLSRHYSPEAPLFLISCDIEEDILRFAEQHGLKTSEIALILTRLEVREQYMLISHLAKEPGAYARALYSTLYQCDERGCKAIIVQAPPRTSQWEGVWDRLKRASGREVLESLG